jgi:predicted dehydrogenase
MNELRVGMVGCGLIARGYLETLAPHRQVRLIGATDLEPARAESTAAAFGGRAYRDLESMLADEDIDAVLNLTVQTAHYDVTARCLRAGKHVYSEKPLALTYPQAAELVELARVNGLRLSCAPMTFLGQAQQTAWQVLREGRLGQLRVAYADMNWGRPETWHPEPSQYFGVGPLYDIGVYSLTLLTTFLGPATAATGFGRVLLPERDLIGGQALSVTTPDFVVAIVEFGTGAIARLTTDFYVGHATKQKGLEFHGDSGSLYLSNPQHFDSVVQFAEYGGEFEPVPYLSEPFPGTEWARGLVELADAIAQDRPHRVTGEQAAHVVEILNAISTSLSSGSGPVPINSVFTVPEPGG